MNLNEDGRISREEYHAALEGNIRGNDGVEAVIVPFWEAILDLADESGDGALDVSEFVKVLAAFGVSEPMRRTHVATSTPTATARSHRTSGWRPSGSSGPALTLTHQATPSSGATDGGVRTSPLDIALRWPNPASSAKASWSRVG